MPEDEEERLYFRGIPYAESMGIMLSISMPSGEFATKALLRVRLVELETDEDD